MPADDPSRLPLVEAPDAGSWFASGNRCAAAAGWFDRLGEEFPDLARGNPRSEVLQRFAQLMISDREFIPQFGQAYDRMSRENRLAIARMIEDQCVRDPFLRHHFAHFAAVRQVLVAEEDDVGRVSHPLILERLREARRVERAALAELAALRENRPNLSQASSAAARITRALEANEALFWPSESLRLEEELAQVMDALARANLDELLAGLPPETDPEARLAALEPQRWGQGDWARWLDDAGRRDWEAELRGLQRGSLDRLLAPVAAALDSLPAEPESLARLEALRNEASPLLARVAPQVAAPWQSSLGAARDRLVGALSAAALAGLDGLTPDPDGLASGAAWLETQEDLFVAYADHPDYLRMLDTFAAQRYRLLDEALPDFAARLANTADPASVLASYLLLPQDRQGIVALEYEILARSRGR